MQIFSEVAFSADTPLPLPSCHFGTESEHIAQGSLIYRFTNACWCLLTAPRNVDRHPRLWLGWSGVGWGGAGLAGGHTAQTAIGWFDGSYPGSWTAGNSRAFHFRGHFEEIKKGGENEGVPHQRVQTPARQNAHTCAYFEGHWTWGEWLRGGPHLVSSYWNPSLYTSAMKHLPIKSNDACDSRGIKVKWCIQRHDGHLQMASVQERDHQLATLAFSSILSHLCFSCKQNGPNGPSYQLLMRILKTHISRKWCKASWEKLSVRKAKPKRHPWKVYKSRWHYRHLKTHICRWQIDLVTSNLESLLT